MPAKVTPGSITQTTDAMKDRVNNISNVSSAINRMQKDVDQKIAETNKRVERKEDVQQVQNLMNQTLGKLNQTIGALTTGVAKITADTARATAQTIGQYGKAISEDISFNKKSVVAMALARTSPIYGYFVAKFMETNVWKQALTKMRNTISQTMGAILKPFKGGAAARGREIPHAQAGGTIAQGGLAKVHAGETITPAGGIGTAGLSELIEIQKQQLSYMQRTFGFEEKYYSTWFQRMSPMRIVRAFRRTKGNYTAQLSSSTQPLTNIAHNLATLYTGLMWRLDNLFLVAKANAEANRDHATFVHKKVYPPIPGIKMRRLAKPLIRKLVGLGVKAAPWLAMAAGLTGVGGIAGAAAGAVGGLGLLAKRGLRKREERRRLEAEAKGEEFKPGFLMKQRGLYAGFKGPGFLKRIKSRLRGAFPTSEMLEQPGGGLGGTVRGRLKGGKAIFGEMDRRKMVPIGRAIAIGFSQVFGGRRGLKRPIWVSPLPGKLQKKYYAFSKHQDKIQTKSLKQIQNTSKKHFSIQKRWIALRKKWRTLDWIMKAFSFIGGIVGKITGIITDIFTNVFTNPGVTAAIAGALGLTWLTGNWIKNFINDIFDDQRKKSREAGQRYIEKAQAVSAEGKVTAGQKGYKLQLQSKALKFKSTRISGDASIGVIQDAQKDYIMANPDKYMNIPIDKIEGWRAEWAKSTWTFGRIFTDPYEYGLQREEKFLAWVHRKKSKELLSQVQIDLLTQERSKRIVKTSPQAIAQAKQLEQFKQKRMYETKYKEKTALGKRYHRDELTKNLSRLLQTKYGITDVRRLNELSKSILQSVPSDQISTLYNNPDLFLNYANEAMRKYEELGWWEKKVGGHFKGEAQMFKDIGKQIISDSTPRSINQASLAKEEDKKKAGLVVDPIVNELKEVKGAIKETGKAQPIQQNNFSSSTSLQNTNVNESTSIRSGGRGGGGLMAGNDYWQNKALGSEHP